MQKRVTQRDVAARAGVSQAAVSRVMAEHGYVAEDVRARIMEAAAALGYRPDPVARTLITGRSNIVAVVVGNVVNPFFPVALSALTEALRQEDREVLLFNAAPGQNIDDLIPGVLRYKVAGIIVMTVALGSRAAELCADAGVPYVLFHRYAEQGGAFDVACDSGAGGREAARHLVATGCRPMAYVGGLEVSSPNRDRANGFIAGLREAGLAPVEHLNGAFTYDWGREAINGLLYRHPDLDAVFCGDDAIACGVVDALRYDLGRKVPDEVSVIGFDDVPQANWAAYRLTTVRQPLEAMIAQTLTLLKHPEDEARKLHLLPGEMIIRATTRR